MRRGRAERPEATLALLRRVRAERRPRPRIGFRDFEARAEPSGANVCGYAGRCLRSRLFNIGGVATSERGELWPPRLGVVTYEGFKG